MFEKTEHTRAWEHLELRGNYVGNSLARTLVEAAAFRELRYPGLSGTELTAAGVKRLVTAEHLVSLRALSLAHLPRLTDLDVASNDLRDRALQHLATARFTLECLAARGKTLPSPRLVFRPLSSSLRTRGSAATAAFWLLDIG